MIRKLLFHIIEIKMHTSILRISALLLPILVLIDLTSGQDVFDLTILHVNDFHARFEETNKYSGRCTEKDKLAKDCYGGFARLHYKAEELRQSIPNTLFLSAGDYYQGTVWYSILKWPPMLEFLNMINHDAMSFGNHEFDDGIGGIVPLLNNITFPVLTSNIDDQNEPTIQGKYQNSIVIEKGRRKIGIIGYLTTTTPGLSNTGHLIFKDEVTSIRSEAQRLKGKGVNIIIALGHAGYRMDKKIAEEVAEVDIVVGGHSNTFLYSGEPPSSEEIIGPYPDVVTQSSGKKVYVVQAYAFGKYLGRLDVKFDKNGEVISAKGNPILLDGSIPQDPYVLNALVPWQKEVNDEVQREIGKTYVLLDGATRSCRLRECNMGNLEADAIVYENAKYPDDEYWAHTGLAVINSGGIRSSIDEKANNGIITMYDVLTVAPFDNTIDIVELKGKHVREMFEYAVHNYDVGEPRGHFLQVSGFHLAYDLERPVGSRVVLLQAKCVKCRVPRFEDVKDDEIYKIGMPSFLANGGDGFTVISDNKIQHHLMGSLDSNVFSKYIEEVQPIILGVENRIIFVDKKHPCKDFIDVSQPSNKTAYDTDEKSQASYTTYGSFLMIVFPLIVTRFLIF